MCAERKEVPAWSAETVEWVWRASWLSAEQGPHSCLVSVYCLQHTYRGLAACSMAYVRHSAGWLCAAQPARLWLSLHTSDSSRAPFSSSALSVASTTARIPPVMRRSSASETTNGGMV